MSESDPAAGDETTYKYNALNQRLSKTTGMFTTVHVWDGGQIAFDAWTVYGYPYYKQYLQGHYQHGAVMFGSFTPNLVNTTGDAVAAITAFNLTTNNMSIGHYEAYGNALATAYAGNPYGYRGYYTDSETGFSYLNARYYDPATQRFTQEDTYWGDNLQRNLYAYCSGNPVMYTDPSGHSATASNGQNSEFLTFPGVLRQGSEGQSVKRLQMLLNYNGANLVADGKFGPLTEMAVRRFQSSQNITADGIVGQQTWTKLVTAWQSRTQGGINSSVSPSSGVSPTPAPTPDPTPAPRPTPDPTPTPTPIDRDINTWYNNDMHILIQLARYYGAEIDGPVKSIIEPNAFFGCSIGITIQLIYESAAAIQSSNKGINVTAGSMDFFVGLTFGFTELSHGIFYGYSTANISYKFAYGGNWYQQTVDYILSYRTDYGVTALIKINLTINRFTKAFVVVLAGGLIFVGVPAPSLVPGGSSLQPNIA